VPRPANPAPSVDLHKLFFYEPKLGRLIVRKTKEEITGPLKQQSGGYFRVRINKRYYPATRVIWALAWGKWPDSNLVVDHINGDIYDNRLENLRLLTHRDNLRNNKARRAELMRIGDSPLWNNEEFRIEELPPSHKAPVA
jgi:hypothetical protein